ncbi:MAG: hypothetical protein JF616_17280 [Fibrobacteres bacterium]|nr:hypothetical protein [Fibrobacterota bacterium]
MRGSLSRSQLFATCLLLGLPGCLVPNGPLAASVSDIKPGEWFEVPDSKLEKVVPAVVPEGSWNGFQAIMQSWSGGALDSKRERLIVWGGGHHDYSGNEIYAFDLNKLAWSRLTDPSQDVGGDESTGEYPDGKPRSRHTYNYIQYVPAIDRFCTLGGQGMFPSGQVGTDATHCFDFETSAWERKGAGAKGSIGGISGVDESTGKVYMHTSGSNARLLIWDPKSDTWSAHANYPDGWFGYYFTGSVGGGYFIAIGTDNNGKASVLTWNLASPDAAPRISDAPADVEPAAKPNPGFTYDSKRNLFVAWAGGAQLWTYNPVSSGWDKVPVSLTNKVVPTSAESLGTFGRFRYVPSKDVFVGVNRTSENVWIFRMPASIPLAASKNPGNGFGVLRMAKPSWARAYRPDGRLRKIRPQGDALDTRIRTHE